MMFSEGYHYWGMHLLWWAIWMILLIWIFATPYHIPGQRAKKDAPIDILKKRLALGEINTDEFLEKKKHINSQ
ncbi:MAG: putative membrane protein [Saprospiraceae bacterium]|jgi:putative membrane protein